MPARRFALDFTRKACAEQFLAKLHPIGRAGAARRPGRLPGQGTVLWSIDYADRANSLPNQIDTIDEAASGAVYGQIACPAARG